VKSIAVERKRGRPSFADDSIRKSINMTICLTPGTHEGLSNLAKSNSVPTATMARQIIENEIEKKEITSFPKVKDIKFTEVTTSTDRDENGKLVLDESEEKAVRFLRSLGMKVPTELDMIVLKAFREAKMPHEHILDFIKKSHLQ